MLSGTALAATNKNADPPQPVSTANACPPSQVSNSNFSDVHTGDYSAVEIACIADYGIAKGYKDGTYKPANDVSRGEMALFFYRLGSDAGVSWDTTSNANRFPDVNPTTVPDASERSAIIALANAGIVSGYPDGTYRAGAPVKRDEMAKFIALTLAKASGSSATTNPAGNNDYYSDDDGDVLEGYINAITALGIAQGVDKSHYVPAANVHRNDMAQFIARSVALLVAAGKIPNHYQNVSATTVAYSTTSPKPGDTVTETVKGQNITGVSVSGPCVSGPNNTVTQSHTPSAANAVDTITVNVPISQTATGSCTITTTVTYANKQAETFTQVLALGGQTPGTTNQAFAVTPTDTVAIHEDQTRTYTVTGVPNGTSVDIVLINCRNVTVDQNGVATFLNSSAPGSATGNNMQQGYIDGAYIAKVNNTPQTNQVGNDYGVQPVNGQINFTIADNTPNPQSDPGVCVAPVVFVPQTNGNNQLSLGANNQPVSAQQFGVGGDTFFQPFNAQAGQIAGNGTIAQRGVNSPGFNSGLEIVQSVDKVQHTFVACENYTQPAMNGAAAGTAGMAGFAGPCYTYTYGPNDSYQISEPARASQSFSQQTPGGTTYDTFNKNLSPYDYISGTVAAGGANSYTLYDVAPEPPQNVYAYQGPNANNTPSNPPVAPGTTTNPNPSTTPASTTVVYWTDSPTPTTTSYNVYRAPAIDRGINSNAPRYVCPNSTGTTGAANTFPNTSVPDANGNATSTLATPYTLLGSVPDQDPNGATASQYSYADNNVPAGRFCYAVTSVDTNSGAANISDQGVPAFANSDNAVFPQPNGYTTQNGTPVAPYANATPGAVAGPPTIQQVYAQENAQTTAANCPGPNTAGQADCGDEWQFIMNEPMNPVDVANNATFTVRDADGTISTISCGSTAVCTTELAGTFNGTAYANDNQVVRVLLTSTPTPDNTCSTTDIFGNVQTGQPCTGTSAGLQYPLTITAATNFTDADEGLNVDLANSPDKTIENGATLTPNDQSIVPQLTGAFGVANGPSTVNINQVGNVDEVYAFYNVNVACQSPNSQPGQFTYNNIPAIYMTCADPSNAGGVTLDFPTGTLNVNGTGTLAYNQATAAAAVRNAANPNVLAKSPDATTLNGPNGDIVQGRPNPQYVAPNTGSPGDTVTIHGDNFQCASSANNNTQPVVYFVDQNYPYPRSQAGVTNCTPTTITATVPANPGSSTTPNQVDIQVVNPNGASGWCYGCFTYNQVQQPAPTIQSAVINPAADTIVVTYDQSVTCSNTAGGRAAWNFTNTYTGPDAGSSGAPTSVTQPSSNQCTLHYANLGPNDRGTLNYTQPAAAPDQVQNSQGTPAPSQSASVDDSSAPVFTTASYPFSGTTVVVNYNEGVLCTTVDAGDYNVQINGTSQTVLSATCTGTVTNGYSQQVTITIAGTTPSTNSGQSVTVTARNGNDGNTVSDGATNFQPVGDSVTATGA